MRTEKLSPKNIALGYFMLSSLWIIASDTLLFAILPQDYWELGQNIKGWFFVSVMSILLWYLLRVRNKEIDSLNELRYESNKMLMRSIAHHWRQPLAYITLAIENIQDRIRRSEIDQSDIHVIDKVVKECQDLSRAIKIFSDIHKESEGVEKVSLKDVIETLKNICKSEMEGKNIRFETNVKDCLLFANRSQLIGVLLNFVNNSVESVLKRQESVNIEGKVSINTLIIKNSAVIEIIDNGTGFDEEVLDYIFMPYLSTKFPSKNIGISLYWNKRYIEEYLGGSIEIDSIKNEGARIIVRIPFAV